MVGWCYNERTYESLLGCFTLNAFLLVITVLSFLMEKKKKKGTTSIISSCQVFHHIFGLKMMKMLRKVIKEITAFTKIVNRLLRSRVIYYCY